MPSLASGWTCCTAWARTWAVLCRSTARPSSEPMSTGSTTSPSASTWLRSTRSSLTRATTVRRSPSKSAPAVVPSATDRSLPATGTVRGQTRWGSLAVSRRCGAGRVPWAPRHRSGYPPAPDPRDAVRRGGGRPAPPGRSPGVGVLGEPLLGGPPAAAHPCAVGMRESLSVVGVAGDADEDVVAHGQHSRQRHVGVDAGTVLGRAGDLGLDGADAQPVAAKISSSPGDRSSTRLARG